VSVFSFFPHAAGVNHDPSRPRGFEWVSGGIHIVASAPVYRARRIELGTRRGRAAAAPME
jgi:hypothetical protein